MTSRVLITGAAGFIGRHVAREFSNQGWHVVGMGRGDWADWQSHGISEWHRCEVTLDALLKHANYPDVIVHCAGGASVGHSVAEPYQDFIKTVDTLAQVLEFMRVHAPQTKLVYPSSAAVYGQIKTLPITEDAPLNPVSPYGFHKKMAELLCEMYSHQYGVPIAVVRLFSIYGIGLRKQLLWDACRKFEQEECSFFGTGAEVRDWLHVEDAARLLYLATQNATLHCPIINAGSGQGVTVKEILQHVRDQLEVLKEPNFSSKSKEGDPNAYIADITNARTWGWEPKINLRKGIVEYVDWYKKCQ